jgi:salicylate hydroxylase
VAHRILIAGAGIGGLAAALALAQRGCEVTVIDSANEFGEVGAGIQLGPNAVKVLAALGLEAQLQGIASFPESIVIADAAAGKVISRMLLGEAVRQRYGQAYACVHRADLHALLLNAVQAQGVRLLPRHSLQKYEHSGQYVKGLGADFAIKADALVGADGLWSRVRAQLLQEGSAVPTGHAAFRAVLPWHAVPAALREPQVRLWWGAKVHVVSYPLRGEALWNVVVLAEMNSSDDQGWNLTAQHHEVMSRIQETEPLLRSLLEAVGAQPGAWRRWNLFDRRSVSAEQMAQGRVALLGDAAHPMLPYMAQGAAMALEDAWALAHALSVSENVCSGLRAYATARAARNARVVRTASRNGRIFHLSGALAFARDTYLALKDTQTVGLAWLYGFNPCASATLAVLD